MNRLTTILSFVLVLTMATAQAGYVDVTEFGANGQDDSDDTQAFLGAIAALGTRTACIRIPAGRYYLDRKLSLQLATHGSALSIVGDGLGVSVLMWGSAATSQGIEINYVAPQQVGALWHSPVTIENVTLSTARNAAGTALTINSNISDRTPGGLLIRRLSIDSAHSRINSKIGLI